MQGNVRPLKQKPGKEKEAGANPRLACVVTSSRPGLRGKSSAYSRGGNYLRSTKNVITYLSHSSHPPLSLHHDVTLDK